MTFPVDTYSRPIPRPLTTRVRAHRALIEQIVSTYWPTLRDGADWIEIAVLVGSGGNPRAVSESGAQGLLCIDPASYVLADPFNPAENLEVGVRNLTHCYDKFGDVPDHFNRLLWSFAAHIGGLRGLGFAQAALKLSRADIPEDLWWKWTPGKFWLMNRKCNVSYRYPDYASIWNFVDSIIRYSSQRTH